MASEERILILSSFKSAIGLKYKQDVIDMHNLLFLFHTKMDRVHKYTPDSYSPIRNIEEVCQPGERTILALVDDVAAGMLTFGTFSEGKNKVGYIFNLYIHEEYRDQGIFSKMFKVFEEQAKKARCHVVGLGAAVDNEHAVEIYKHMGFEETYVNMYKLL